MKEDSSGNVSPGQLLECRDNFLTPRDVACVLRVKETTIREWLRKGNLTGYKLPGGWRVRAGDLLDFIERFRSPSGAGFEAE